MAWLFESVGIGSIEKYPAYYIKIEISDPQDAYDDSATGGTNKWASGIAAPVFSSPVSAPFVFSQPEISRVAQQEEGAVGMGSMQLEASNDFLGTAGGNVASGALVTGRIYKVVGYTSVTHNSIVYTTGQYFTAVNANYTTAGAGTVERLWTLYDVLRNCDMYRQDLHVRVSTKAEGGAYLVRFWGIVDFKSVEVEENGISNRQDWMVSFTVVDAAQQAKRRTASQWMNDNLTHAAYDYTATDAYLSFIGNLVWGSSTYYAGRYKLNAAFVNNQDSDGGQWLAASTLRWIKLVDMFQSLSDYLGYGTTVNNGAAWSGMHTWDFYYNTHSPSGPGGETLNAVGLDGLYVVSAFYNGSNYVENFSLFDDRASTSYSLKVQDDAFEAIKKICVSLGLVIRTKFTAAGARYLAIEEAGRMGATVAVTDFDYIKRGIKFKPNARAIDGVEVPSYASPTNTKRGAGESSNSIKFDCLFSTCNNARTNEDFRRQWLVSGNNNVDWRPVGSDFYCALWALAGGSGKAAATAHSVCMIVPKDNDNTQPSQPPNVPPYGEWRAGLTAVAYPNSASPYSSWIEVPAMALAHYSYNDVSFTADPVGLARPKGEEIELTKFVIDHTAIQEPPFKMTITLHGEAKEYLIRSVKENLDDDEIEYSGYTRSA